MVDATSFTGIDTGAIKQAAYSGGYATTVFALYALILLGLLFLVGFIMYKRTFNIKVTILDNTKGGIVFRDDYQGKLSQVRPGEFRFKIWKGKTANLRYNQESFSTEHLYYDVSKSGKLKRRLLMTFDTEGQLVPVSVSSLTMKVPVKDATGAQLVKDGIPVYEDSTTIKATVKQVDIAWFYKELDKSVELFDARSFWDKNGFLIIAICLILTLGVFGYTAYKLSEAATKMGDVVVEQGKLISIIEQGRNITNAVSTNQGGFKIPGGG